MIAEIIETLICLGSAVSLVVGIAVVLILAIRY